MSRWIAVLMLSLYALGAQAHGESKDQKAAKRPAAKAGASVQETAFGREGELKKATRTIRVDMSDRMRFTPSALTIKRGETVRFLVKNSGQVLHEMVLGTLKELKEHAELMKKHPGMEHDEPYMAHVDPGKTGQIVWQFTRAGEYYFGCLVPGHFEAGMIGKVIVK